MGGGRWRSARADRAVGGGCRLPDLHRVVSRVGPVRLLPHPVAVASLGASPCVARWSEPTRTPAPVLGSGRFLAARRSSFPVGRLPSSDHRPSLGVRAAGNAPCSTGPIRRVGPPGAGNGKRTLPPDPVRPSVPIGSRHRTARRPTPIRPVRPWVHLALSRPSPPVVAPGRLPRAASGRSKPLPP